MSKANPNIVSILSLDGGGMRGYLSACWMKNFITAYNAFDGGGVPLVNQEKMLFNEIWRHFDVICGTSIGGIQALAYAFGVDLDQVLTFFEEDGPWIFTIRNSLDVAMVSCSASEKSNRPNQWQKIGMLTTGDAFYKSVREAGTSKCEASSNYGDLRLRAKLEQTFNSAILSDLKTNVAILSMNADTSAPVVFSNVKDIRQFIGYSQKISDVALCTSAAPTYLPRIFMKDSIDGTRAGNYIDGGIFCNNPAGIGFALAEAVKALDQEKESRRKYIDKVCLLSVGTGTNRFTFGKNGQPISGNLIGSMLTDLLSAGMGGSQEAVDLTMRTMSSRYSLENFYYHRAQFSFDPDSSLEMDQSDEGFLSLLRDRAAQDFTGVRRNEIDVFIGHMKA